MRFCSFILLLVLWSFFPNCLNMFQLVPSHHASWLKVLHFVRAICETLQKHLGLIIYLLHFPFGKSVRYLIEFRSVPFRYVTLHCVPLRYVVLCGVTLPCVALRYSFLLYKSEIFHKIFETYIMQLLTYCMSIELNKIKLILKGWFTQTYIVLTGICWGWDTPEILWLFSIDLILSACTCIAMIRIFVLPFIPAINSHMWDSLVSAACDSQCLCIPLGVLFCHYTSCSSSSSSSLLHSASLRLIMSPARSQQTSVILLYPNILFPDQFSLSAYGSLDKRIFSYFSWNIRTVPIHFKMLNNYTKCEIPVLHLLGEILWFETWKWEEKQ